MYLIRLHDDVIAHLKRMIHYLSIERNEDLNYVDLIKEDIECQFPMPTMGQHGWTKDKRSAHAVWNLNYHIVFVTNYRNKVLHNGVDDFLKEMIPKLCEQYGWELLAIEVMPDHVHLFVSAPPTVAPVAVERTLKSIMAVEVFKKFSTLKQRYFWDSGLWNRGCYYRSAGVVSAETIKRYIAQQKARDWYSSVQVQGLSQQDSGVEDNRHPDDVPLPVQRSSS